MKYRAAKTCQDFKDLKAGFEIHFGPSHGTEVQLSKIPQPYKDKIQHMIMKGVLVEFDKCESCGFIGTQDEVDVHWEFKHEDMIGPREGWPSTELIDAELDMDEVKKVLEPVPPDTSYTDSDTPLPDEEPLSGEDDSGDDEVDVNMDDLLSVPIKNLDDELDGIEDIGFLKTLLETETRKGAKEIIQMRIDELHSGETKEE